MEAIELLHVQGGSECKLAAGELWLATSCKTDGFGFILSHHPGCSGLAVARGFLARCSWVFMGGVRELAL